MTTLDTLDAVDTAPAPPTGTTNTTDAAIPLRRITRTELRKMFDTRSGFWLLASIAILALLATATVILFGNADEMTYSTFVAAIGIPMTLVLPVMAILSVTAEWSQRSGLTTFILATIAMLPE